MSEAKLHLNGLISAGQDNDCTVSFDEPVLTLETLLTIIKAEVPGKAIAFIALNGTKATMDSIITDGDIIDIYPAITGADKNNRIPNILTSKLKNN